MDLTLQPRVRQLVTDAEALATRVRQLPDEVPATDQLAAWRTVGLVNRDQEVLVKAYHEWNAAAFLTAAGAIVRMVREDLTGADFLLGSTQVETELLELVAPIAQGYYHLQAAWAPVSV